MNVSNLRRTWPSPKIDPSQKLLLEVHWLVRCCRWHTARPFSIVVVKNDVQRNSCRIITEYEAKFEALHLTFDSVLQSSTWPNDWAFRVTNPKWSSSRFQWKPAKCQVTEIKDGSLTSKRPAETRSEPEARCIKATSSATFDDQSHCRHRFLSWQTTCVGVVLDHILQHIHGRLILRMQLTHQPPRCRSLLQVVPNHPNSYQFLPPVFPCLFMSFHVFEVFPTLVESTFCAFNPASITPLMTTASKTPQSLFMKEGV